MTAGTEGEDMYDEWMGPAGPAQDLPRGELTEVVLLRGEVIDVRHRPVSGSGYECAALERQYPPSTPPALVVRESPHELMSDWLARAVGGEEALAGLDAIPLPDKEPLDRERIPEPEREIAVVVDELITAAAAGWVVQGEMLTVCRRLLVAAARSGMLRAWRDLEPAQVATAVVHCGAKANGFVGTGSAFTVAHWLRDLGTTSAPVSRSSRLALTLGGAQWPHGRPPTEAPDVYLLGDPGLLVGRFRRQLIAYRELARRAAAQPA